MEPERGPLEQELFEQMRLAGLGDPVMLEAAVTGDSPRDLAKWIDVLIRGHLRNKDMILRLARELDQRASEDR